MTPELVRGLGQLDATMIVVGILIGSGIFIVSAEFSRLVGAPGWLLAIWALAADDDHRLPVLRRARSDAAAGAGEQYVFLREAYNPALAFLFGWALFLLSSRSERSPRWRSHSPALTGVLIGWVSGSNYIVEPIVLGGYTISLSTQQFG